MIQVYGHFSDRLSFAQVSRAIVQYAVRKLHQPFLIHEIGTMAPTYNTVVAPIGINSHAPIGICVGYPPVARSWLEGHDVKILVTVCESDRIPESWVQACNRMDLVIVPSRFCLEVFKRSGVRSEIHVLQHGVSRTYADAEPSTVPRPKHLQLLHVSGAASFPQRKGTSQLLIAFRRLLKTHPNVVLILRVADEKKFESAIHELGIEKNVMLSPSTYPMNVLIENVDAVVQPSRGEGFGMVPLEARCMGVPAILTNATGHEQHFAPGVDIPIKVGPLSYLATQGNEDGRCPEVTVESILEALQVFVERPHYWRDAAQGWAKRYAAKWLWSNVTQPLCNELRRRSRTRIGRPGDESSLRGL